MIPNGRVRAAATSPSPARSGAAPRAGAAARAGRASPRACPGPGYGRAACHTSRAIARRTVRARSTWRHATPRQSRKSRKGGDYQVRCFFGEEVTGGQGLAADVAGVLPPDAERLVIAADETLRPPQHQDRAFELLPGGKGLVVVDKVDARRRAVVGARARDRPGVAEAADVVRHRGGVDARALRRGAGRRWSGSRTRGPRRSCARGCRSRPGGRTSGSTPWPWSASRGSGHAGSARCPGRRAG